jgi:phage tail sheath protein FI
MSPMGQYLSPGVYMEEVDKGSKPIEAIGTALAGFVGFAAQGPVGCPTLVTSWTQFTETFGGFLPDAYLAHAVYGYFNNGGSRAYITRLPGGDEADKATDGRTRVPRLTMPTLSLPGATGSLAEAIRIRPKDEGQTGENIIVEVGPASGEPAPSDQVKITVRRGDVKEEFDNLTIGGRGPRARNLDTVLQRDSKLITAEIVQPTASVADLLPKHDTYTLTNIPSSQALAAVSAPAAVEVSLNDLKGDAAERTGVNGLEVLDDCTMVCFPDIHSPRVVERFGMDGIIALQEALLTHCTNMKDRFAILDAPRGMKPQQIREWRLKAPFDSSYGALYYPWIKVANPFATGANDMLIEVPPSGHIAGIYARVDGTRGVHKAPANETVGGAIGLEYQISKGEQDSLNPIGVNCIRAFPGRGIRVWGARTLSSDPAWRYINVRRLFIMVEGSIKNGTQWVVFEPNDVSLWERVKRNVSAFLTMVWRDGALFGDTPEASFYVKCDAELNPPESRDLGMLVCEIGICPVKPAEFVIFRVTQWQGEGA